MSPSSAGDFFFVARLRLGGLEEDRDEVEETPVSTPLRVLHASRS